MNREIKNNRNPASVPRSQSFQTGSFLKADKMPRAAVITILTSELRAKKTPILHYSFSYSNRVNVQSASGVIQETTNNIL
jgi:hypothetical protein